MTERGRSPGPGESGESGAAPPPMRRGPTPSERLRQAERSHRAMLIAVRLLYMVLLVTVTLLPFVGKVTAQTFGFRDYAGAFIATFLFGAAVLVIDALTPNKKLASVFAIYLGLVAGLAGAVAVGALLDLIAKSWELTTARWDAYLGLTKFAIGITLCYLAVSIVLTTKDDFRLVIPYVEFARQVRGVRPLLLDTSALIDGRIDGFAQTGFLDAQLVVPQFVVNELQTLADSSDKLKRARGRRGLDMVSTLQANPVIDASIDPIESTAHTVDHMLLEVAENQQLRILTTDYNLNKVAQIRGLTVLNLNDLAGALRPQVIAGDHLQVDLAKRGEAAGQGVGYLPDGTMVVVENAASHVGSTVAAIVTNALQTSAGRMIFARLVEAPAGAAPGREAERSRDMAESATRQPRGTAPPARPPEGSSRRNPRR